MLPRSHPHFNDFYEGTAPMQFYKELLGIEPPEVPHERDFLIFTVADFTAFPVQPEIYSDWETLCNDYPEVSYSPLLEDGHYSYKNGSEWVHVHTELDTEAFQEAQEKRKAFLIHLNQIFISYLRKKCTQIENNDIFYILVSEAYKGSENYGHNAIVDSFERLSQIASQIAKVLKGSCK